MKVTILEGVVTVDLSLNLNIKNILETSKKVQEKVKPLLRI